MGWVRGRYWVAAGMSILLAAPVALTSTRAGAADAANGEYGIACATVVKQIWLRPGVTICPHTANEGMRRIQWVLHPDEPPPDPESKSVVVAVHEGACASRRNPIPHLGRPEVRYLRQAVVISLWIHPPEGAQLCPANPVGRLRVKLPGPLGGRGLYDGATAPPRKVQYGEDPRRPGEPPPG